MKNFTPLLHKFKFIIGYSIATVVIVFALAVSGVRFLLTTANLYQDEVEKLASGLLEQPVKIGRMDAKLSGLIPVLIFHDVNILSAKNNKSLLSLSRIDIGVSLKSLLLQQEILPTELTVRGVDLNVTRTVEGKIKVKGVDIEGVTLSTDGNTEPFIKRWLLQQSEIAVEDSSVTWKDEQNSGLTWYFYNISFLLKNSTGRHQVSLVSNLPGTIGEKVNVEMDIEGDVFKPAELETKVFIESNGVNIQPFNKYYKTENPYIESGNANLRLWVDLHGASVKHVSGNVTATDFIYSAKKNKKVKLDTAAASFDAEKHNQTWFVGIKDFNYKKDNVFWPETDFSLAVNYSGKVFNSLYVDAAYLKLSELTKIISDNQIFDASEQNEIKKINMSGEIRNFHFAWQKNAIQNLRFTFNNLKTNASDKIPEVQRLSGKFEYDGYQGNIKLKSKNASISFDGLFRKKIKLNNLAANVDFFNNNKALIFDISYLVAANDDVDTMSAARLWWPKDNSSPYLDLQTYARDGNAASTPDYLPVSIMDPSLVKWLDNAIVAGRLNKAQVIFNGKLNAFPFKRKEGVLLIDIDTSDVTFNYQDGWPQISKAKIKGLFTEKGLRLDLVSGTAKNVDINNSYAEIPVFLAPELQLKLSTKATAENTVSYLVNSPVLSQARKSVKSMRLLGNIATEFNVQIPLSGAKKNVTYTGSANIQNASLFMLNDKIELTNLSGQLDITEKNISGQSVTATLFDEPVKFSVFSPAKNKNVVIAARGEINPAKILRRFELPGSEHISGNTGFYGEMIFPDNSTKNTSPELVIKSDLLGISSKLPGAFAKDERTKEPFEFALRFNSSNKNQLRLEFPEKLSSVLELKFSKDQASLVKGAVSVSAKAAVLPENEVLYIDGTIARFSPSDWLSALKVKKDSRSKFMTPVIFNLEELNLYTNDEKEKQENKTTIAPQDFPLIEGIIKKLSLDNMLLGRLDFKTSYNKYGMHLDELILSAKNMKLDAYGDWRYSHKTHETNLNVTLSSKNFGAMLNDLGFAAILENGNAQALAKLNWKGMPSQFSLAKLGSTIKLNIEDGSVKEVDAGAGRLLGLLSLSALPRKLLGDFKDTFKTGFSFDQAKGDIRIIDGNAYTNTFEVNSAVAKMRISGRTGLVARDYENTIIVVPEVGGTVAGVAALLINLPAGVGLWLLDKITGEKFNQASATIYEISGSWESPKIEKLNQQQ